MGLEQTVSLLNMRSDLSVLRSEEAILRVATELFAAEGSERVTIRKIAESAGVSPALVIHHFGSRAGLRNAVEERVVARFNTLIAQLETSEVAEAAHGIGELIARVVDEEPAVFSFIRRMMVEGGPSADAAFLSLFGATKRTLAALDRMGATRPTGDEDTRAAFLLANDLAVLLLRDRILAATGVDPLAGEGLHRWVAEVMAVYSGGVFRQPGAPPTASPGPTSPKPEVAGTDGEGAR